MKRSYSFVIALLCVMLLAFVAVPSAMAAVLISPNGSAYTGISASSSLNANYTPDNLFDQAPVVGQEIGPNGSDAGTAWAGSIAENYSHYVAFQLDQAYTIASLFYAQRDFNNLHNSGADKVSFIEVWTGSSAFTPANPGSSPDATANITNLTDDTFLEYPLSVTIAGQYFLLHVSNSNYGTSPANGVIGGAELRLGAAVPEPSMLIIAPVLLVMAPLVKRAVKSIRNSV